jgi:hypothetical protein
MVQKLADQIRACRARAEHDRVREQLLSLAEQWQEVVESYRFIESLEPLLHQTMPEDEKLPKDFPPG